MSPPSGSILWFRHGLRLHDNPALIRAIKNRTNQLFYPVFIFDGETAGTKIVGYNRMKFLMESLQDLDDQLRAVGGRLFTFRGSPTEVFTKLKEEINLKLITFEQDCEPCWRTRDNSVKRFCDENGIEWSEHVSHTLWDPFEITATNGGQPPLTYQSYTYIANIIGDPQRPAEDADWDGVNFGDISESLASQVQLFANIPTPEDFKVFPEHDEIAPLVKWKGGERHALEHLKKRLEIETNAFRSGYYLPNQLNPDLLGPPTSQSAALRFGCLSVRRFYWSIHNLYKDVHGDKFPTVPHITGQLIWREFFYTMSINNPYFGEMERNKICIDIPWSTSKEVEFKAWCMGKTGFPFIDAAMRQLLAEGWIHHVARNAVACFLTRGDLWISWERGLDHFLKYLLDADWSVCTGNWIWVSSSAFEQMLDSGVCVCPVSHGRRFDPYGEYVKRYIPELRLMPLEYLYEPWKAPLEVQQRAKCVLGRDYPERIVDHLSATRENGQKMETLRATLQETLHCRPSSKEEIEEFFRFPKTCYTSDEV